MRRWAPPLLASMVARRGLHPARLPGSMDALAPLSAWAAPFLPRLHRLRAAPRAELVEHPCAGLAARSARVPRRRLLDQPARGRVLVYPAMAARSGDLVVRARSSPGLNASAGPHERRSPRAVEPALAIAVGAGAGSSRAGGARCLGAGRSASGSCWLTFGRVTMRCSSSWVVMLGVRGDRRHGGPTWSSGAWRSAWAWATSSTGPRGG